MEHIKEEEIIGYRIGQGLFCVDCYEETAKDLKSVQNSEDPEVKLPSRAITADDVSIFICEQCKGIKGPSAPEVKIQERKGLVDLLDMVEICREKLAFLEDFITHSVDVEDLFSENGKSGFYRILVDLQDTLGFVTNEVSERHLKGLIIEKQGAN